MLVQPYLSFDGRCEEAIEFYREALGAETTMLMRFKESPEPPPPGMVPPGSENKIMHASLRIGDTTVRRPTALARASRVSREYRCR
jgi:PhnB protein